MIANILKGITAYFGTISLISKLRLWKYFIIPILISVFIGLSIFTLAYFLSDNISNLIAKLWIWERGAQTFETISQIVGGLAIVAIGLVFYKHIVMALSAPFMSPVSEKIEAHLLNAETPSLRETTFMQQLIRGIQLNLRNLFRELGLIVPLLLLSFLPVVGIVCPFLIFLVQAYYVGFGNMDYTMERHLNYNDSIQFVRQHRGTAIGNGIIFMLMLFIPLVGFIITMPISVVAASTETVKILNNK